MAKKKQQAIATTVTAVPPMTPMSANEMDQIAGYFKGAPVPSSGNDKSVARGKMLEAIKFRIMPHNVEEVYQELRDQDFKHAMGTAVHARGQYGQQVQSERLGPTSPLPKKQRGPSREEVDAAMAAQSEPPPTEEEEQQVKAAAKGKVAASTKKSAKATAKVTPKAAAKAKDNGGGRERIDTSQKIYPLVKENPRAKPSSGGYKSFALILKNPGQTIAEFKERGGRMEDLRWDLERERLELRPGKGAAAAKNHGSFVKRSK